MSLFKHQSNIVKKANSILDRFGLVILELDCRVGKSRIALSLVEQGKSCLFVTKKKAIGSVLSDLEEFDGLEVTVCNREAIKGEICRKYDYVIVDEMHHAYSSYPKASKAWKMLKPCCNGSKMIFLSATPCVESGSQMYYPLKLSDFSPFGAFPTFYKWHKQFGVPKKIKIAGGMEVNSYDLVKNDMIQSVLGKYTLTLTQEEAGFKGKVEIVKHKLINDEISAVGRYLKRKKMYDFDGELVVCDNPATLSQKLHMIAGGTCTNEDGEAFILPIGFDPFYKVRFLMDKLDSGRKYSIFTNFVEERALVYGFLKDFVSVTLDFDEFESGQSSIFVGSLKQYCEGVDLSWVDSIILYSFDFSAASLYQVVNRMQHYNRVDEMKVHLLLHEHDERVLESVMAKLDGKI